MRSPIKNLKKKTNSLTKIKEIIPKGSVVESHLFYDGSLDFNLSEADRFVLSATDKYVVYEFWACALENPKKVADIADYLFPSLNEQTFDLLQKDWARYKDPYVRSAFFAPKNFHLASTRDKKLEESVGNSEGSTHILIHAGKFSFHLFEHGATESLEETKFNHNKLLDSLSTTDKKTVVIYDFHPRLKTYKNKFDLLFLDESGRETDESNAKEIILHNV
jgi:hypothetical protein